MKAIPSFLVAVSLLVALRKEEGVSAFVPCRPAPPFARGHALKTRCALWKSPLSQKRSSPPEKSPPESHGTVAEPKEEQEKGQADAPPTLLSSLPAQLSTSSTSPLPPVVGAVAVLAIVVLLHEAGHYVAGRAVGLHADEFSVGFGPRLASFRAFGGDEFAVRAILAGGYCSFDHAELLSRPWNEQALILTGGIVANLLLSLLLYTYQAWKGDGLLEYVLEPGLLVTGIAGPDAAAYGKVSPGDVIVAVNGKLTTTTPTPTVPQAEKAITKAIRAIQSTPQGESVQLSIRRRDEEPLNAGNGEVQVVDLLPQRNVDEKGKQQPPSLGIFLEPNWVDVRKIRADSLPGAAGMSVRKVREQTSETLVGLFTYARDLVSGRAATSEYRVRGPLGAVETASTAVATGNASTVLNYVAAMSVNLAAFNAVPVPPLDGFQLLALFARQVFLP